MNHNNLGTVGLVLMALTRNGAAVPTGTLTSGWVTPDGVTYREGPPVILEIFAFQPGNRLLRASIDTSLWEVSRSGVKNLAPGEAQSVLAGLGSAIPFSAASATLRWKPDLTGATARYHHTGAAVAVAPVTQPDPAFGWVLSELGLIDGSVAPPPPPVAGEMLGVEPCGGPTAAAVAFTASRCAVKGTAENDYLTSLSKNPLAGDLARLGW